MVQGVPGKKLVRGTGSKEVNEVKEVKEVKERVGTALTTSEMPLHEATHSAC